jgi:hypothetical protein
MLSSGSMRSAVLPKIFFAVGLCLLIIVIVSHSTSKLGYLSSSFDSIRSSLPGKSIQARMQRSERLWQKSVDERHQMYESFAAKSL